MKKYQNTILWLLAILITLSSAIYQRKTGPTYPIDGDVILNNVTINYSLPRSHDTGIDAEIRIPAPDPQIRGEFSYRRFRSNDEWTKVPLQRIGNDLLASIPKQPAAGKVMYRISLSDGQSETLQLTSEPVIIRFKGSVPAFILVPHIFFMFFAMLLSNRSGLQALARAGNLYKYALWTSGLLLVGGLILGPIVQKYAFGSYWTGWPFGHDLTDNKTIAAFIAWALAIWKNKDRINRPGWVLAASITLFLVYMIPHSVLGSELDYTVLEQ